MLVSRSYSELSTNKPMTHVGAATFVLEITDGITLKDKRHVVKSLLDRARVRFHVAAAEVDQLDSPRWATLVFVAVSNDQGHVSSVLEHVASMVEDETRAVVADYTVEFL
jgi:uncharacterized protein